MAGKIYQSEEEYRLRVVRDNETRKAISSISMQIGAALAAGGVVQVYSHGWSKDPNVGWWFLLAVGLIVAGVWLLRRLQSETDG